MPADWASTGKVYRAKNGLNLCNYLIRSRLYPPHGQRQRLSRLLLRAGFCKRTGGDETIEMHIFF